MVGPILLWPLPAGGKGRQSLLLYGYLAWESWLTFVDIHIKLKIWTPLFKFLSVCDVGCTGSMMANGGKGN